MAEGTQGDSGGRNTMIIAVVAILVVAAIAIWATTRRHPVEKGGGSKSTISGSATVGGKKDADVNLKVNLPDSVTIDAR